MTTTRAVGIAALLAIILGACWLTAPVPEELHGVDSHGNETQSGHQEPAAPVP